MSHHRPLFLNHPSFAVLVALVMTIIAIATTTALGKDVNILRGMKLVPLKPSAAGFLSISYLNQVIKKDKAELEEFILKTPIPNFNVTQSVSLIGDVDVYLTETSIKKIDLGEQIQATLDPNLDAFYIAVSQASITLSTKYLYKQKSFPYMSGSGVANVNTESVYGGIRVVFKLTSDEKPQFVSTIGLELYNMKIHITDGGIQGWFINLMESLFANTVNKMIAKAITSTIEEKVQSMNNYIAQQPFIVPVTFGDKQLMIDFGFDTFETVDYLTIGASSQVRFFSQSLGEKLPFDPVDLPTSVQMSNLLQIYLTDFIPKSFLYSLYQSNQLSYLVTPDMVPPTEMIQLNTTSLKIYLPQLYEKYPNKLVQILLSSSPATSPCPQFNISQTGMNANFKGELLFQVINSPNNIVNAFSLNVDAGFSLDKIDVKNNATTVNLTAVIDNPAVNLTLRQSWIGDMDIKNFAFIVNIVVTRGVVRQLNQQLAEGVPLFNLEYYLPGLVIDDASLRLFNGYMGVAVTGEYKPITKGKVSKGNLKLN